MAVDNDGAVVVTGACPPLVDGQIGQGSLSTLSGFVDSQVKVV